MVSVLSDSDYGYSPSLTLSGGLEIEPGSLNNSVTVENDSSTYYNLIFS